MKKSFNILHFKSNDYGKSKEKSQESCVVRKSKLLKDEITHLTTVQTNFKMKSSSSDSESVMKAVIIYKNEEDLKEEVIFSERIVSNIEG
jgi:hypothetical protein